MSGWHNLKQRELIFHDFHHTTSKVSMDAENCNLSFVGLRDYSLFTGIKPATIYKLKHLAFRGV